MKRFPYYLLLLLPLLTACKKKYLFPKNDPRNALLGDYVVTRIARQYDNNRNPTFTETTVKFGKVKRGEFRDELILPLGNETVMRYDPESSSIFEKSSSYESCFGKITETGFIIECSGLFSSGSTGSSTTFTGVKRQ